MGGGGLIYPPFLRIIFIAKTRHFQGCLRVWSREDQVRRHPCKLRKFAIFYHAKKNHFFFYKYKVKNTPSSLNYLEDNLRPTVCPRSSDPLYIVSYYIKWGHYFLDIQYFLGKYVVYYHKFYE